MDFKNIAEKLACRKSGLEDKWRTLDEIIEPQSTTDFPSLFGHNPRLDFRNEYSQWQTLFRGSLQSYCMQM